MGASFGDLGLEFGRDRSTIFYWSKTDTWKQEVDRVRESRRLESERGKEDFLNEYIAWQNQCKQMAELDEAIASELIQIAQASLDATGDLSPLERIKEARKSGIVLIVNAICKLQDEGCKLMDQALQISEIEKYVIEQQHGLNNRN